MKRGCLLTGAAGFLGRYLVRDLLRAETPLAVLVRPGKFQPARERIEAVLAFWETQLGHPLPRPVVFEGDVTRDDLGLDAAARAWLAQHCDSVLHSAASMIFVPEERSGEPHRTNVEGTGRLIDFCRRVGIRRFHHVSTAYLCGLRQGRVLESELDEGQTLGNVYEESKLAAEKMLTSAGVFDELTIYRPSSIVGDSQTGLSSNYHGFYLPLQLAHAFSSAVPPEVMEERFTSVLGLTGHEGKNLVPVDWLSAAIAYLFTHPEHHGRVYHLTHPRPTTVRLIQSVIAEAIRLYSKRPAAKRIGDRDLAAYERLFQSQMQVYRSHWRDDPVFDRTNTDAALPHLAPPEMDRELLLRVSRYAIENNFSAPRQPATERQQVSVGAHTPELPAQGVAAQQTTPIAGGSGACHPAPATGIQGDAMSENVANVPLAIVGMACRLPGAANLDEYWKLIIEGRSAVGDMPADRFDQELYFDSRQGVRGKAYAKLAATLPTRAFDRAACPISAELEGSVDLAHLLMCEVAAAACRHAGYDPFNLPLRNTGVYIGHAQGSELGGQYTYATCIEEAAHFLDEVEDFAGLPREKQQAAIEQLVATVRGKLPDQGHQTRDVAASMIAGTIAKAFGLTGPYLALNAACASSLHALLIAARALQLGHVDMAIVGGGSDCKGDSLVLFSHAQTLSTSGSRPFDTDADGLILSEGYVAVVVKTLDRALADGDPICAVIRGLGVSSDGKGKSLWAPRKEGQIVAMQRAYAGGLDMADLDYLEAHATATQLGDATELTAVSELLQGRLPAGKKIAVTSVKANIGHALESAGLAGLIKTVLCMQHGTFPPAINVRQLNPKIDWPNVPVYVPLKPEPWPQPANGRPRRAGVNAFGIGGLNMHVVLDEFIPGATPGWHAPELPAKGVVASEPATPIAGSSGTCHPRSNRGEQDLDAQAVAVIGMGCIFPGAANLSAFGELLRSGRDAKSPAPPDRWRTDLAHRPGPPQPFCSPVTRGGYITDFRYDWRTHKIPPKQIEQADPLQFMLLDAADQALRDAGYDKKPYDRSRAGVVVGTEFGGDFAFQLQMALRLPELGRMLREILGRLGVDPQRAAAIDERYAEALLKHWPALIDESGSFSTSALASRINKTWDWMGGAAAIDAGENSALAALSIACDQLLVGDCDLMVCAAGQRRMSLPAYEGLALAGTLATRDDPAAPFDAAAQGYLPGEGVGVLILKRLVDARRDGDPIRAIIHGVAAAHAATPAAAIRTAAERSLSAKSAKAGDIAAIVADGFASPQADAAAVRTLAAVYGAESRQKPLQLSSIVGQLGHLAGASGMASLIKAILEVERGEVTPTVNLRTPSPALAESGVIAAATARAPLGTTPDGRRLAAVVSCGRGQAHHAIIERGAKVEVVESPAPLSRELTNGGWHVPEPPAMGVAAKPRPSLEAQGRATLAETSIGYSDAAPTREKEAWRICRVGAASPDQMTVRLADIDAEALWVASATARFTAADRVRLAIVADNPTVLRQKLQTAAKQFQNAAAAPVLQQQGIFYRRLGMARPRIALLFPGQGSQYADMLRSLVETDSAAAEAMRQFDAAMTKAGYPTFAELAWGDAAALGRDVFLTQAAMLAADTIVLAALSARGIRPDVVAGHSYGEYVALLAAGAWDIAGALRATRARCAAIAESPTARGTMLALQAAPRAVEELIARSRLPAYIANYNAPDQVVAGGAEETLVALAAEAEQASHKTRRLAVPCAFHTPLLKDAAARLAMALADIQIVAPRVQMLSAVSGRCAQTPEEIRANLVAHMTQPVRYSDLVTTLADECETALVEVGPQQVLTGLNRRILQTRDEIMVASDNPKRSGVENILGVEAMLDCAGALDAGQAAPPSVAAAAAAMPAQEILFFDATARRRDKMRRVSTGQPAKAAPAVERPAAERAPEWHVPELPAKGVVESEQSTPIAGGAGACDPQTAPAAPAPVKQLAPLGAELEPFLINFVVEHTGYPPEVVELDADLEADLGIDSIKKAQLFGELREYFDVTPSEDLTLDDFPTLRHVVKFLRGEPIKRAAAQPPTAPGQFVEAGAEHDEFQSSLPASNGKQLSYATATIENVGGSVGLADPPYGNGSEAGWHVPEPPAMGVAAIEQSTPVDDGTVTYDSQTARATTPVKQLAPLGAELEPFLINFVVEQTGYPPEVVELDADLEADLGIDSIKKAQLFGELREYFDVTPSEDLTLDDFPTLRHVVKFLRGEPIKAERVRPGGSAELAAETQPNADDLADGDQKPFSLRFVMRVIDAPLPPDSPAAPTWNGPVLVVGDNPAADALRRRLRACGATVYDLTLSDDLDATLAAFDALWQQGPLPHLFLMGERDDLRDVGGAIGEGIRLPQNAWRQRYDRRVLAPYFLCQRWTQRAVEAGLMGRCTVVAATALGGDFGFSGRVTAPEGGALTGLIKALCIELYVLRNFKGLIVKAIDAPDDEPVDLLAENIVRELGSGKLDYEVAYVRGARRLQNAIAEPAAPQPDAGIRRGAVWVVSGGARGITAACALELGRRFGLKLHLLGTSPLPTIDPSWRNLSDEGLKTLRSSIMIRGRQAGETPDKAWAAVEKAIEMDRALWAFAEAGVAAVYHRCDVANRDALATVLDEIRRTDGPIEGILHGAGIERSARYERKGRDDVLATLGAKIEGAYHLMTLTQQDPVRHFIGFGSIGGRLGSNGQTDYCLASDMLCKLISWYRTLRPECRAVGFHWHPWDEIGMAARPHTRATFEISQGPGLMPKREGLRHLLRELYAGVPRTEVMITDWEYYAQFYVHQKRSYDIAPKKKESAPLPPHRPAVTSDVAGEGRPKTVAQRYIPRLVDAQLPSDGSELRLDGPALIVGDNAVAAALAKRLAAAGTPVHCLAGDDPETLLAAFDHHWVEQPARHLFLLTARDEDAVAWQDRTAWRRRRARGVIGPYLVAQRWMQRLEALPAGQTTTLAAITSLGGDFGLSGAVPAPEGGMLCGLIKSVAIENQRSPRHTLRLKVLDAPAAAPPDAVAEAFCRELAAATPDVEVAWSPSSRRVVRSAVESLDGLPQTDLPHGGVWVVTGGGRGITAASALDLGRRYGLKLHVIGRSPRPKDDAPWRGCDEAEMKRLKASIVHAAVAAGRSPEEDWLRIKNDVEIHQTLEAYRAAGVTCTYHACDVADWDALARTLDEIRRDGPIEGVLHGAGFGRPGRLAQKDRAVLERTVSAKVDGAVALMALTANDPLRWFVGFGSLSGRFGGNGLSDYAGANDMFAKLIDGFRRPGCAAVCLHWQTWDAVGMATLADGMAINKGVLQMAFIPPAEGVAHLDRELRAGLPAREVVITDGHFEQTFYPHHAAPTAPVAPRRDMPPDKTARPLIESVTPAVDGQQTACVRFDPTRDPFLAQHRLRGKPFLPAVIGLESLAEAAALVNPTRQVVALRDVEIVNGLLFHGETPVEVEVTIAPTDGGFACTLTSCQRDRKGRVIDAHRPHVRGAVELGTLPEAITAAPPGEPPLGWTPGRYAEDGLMYHGPALRCLKDVAYQYDGGFGRITAPPLAELAGERPTAGWLLPSAVLDACLYACGGFTFFQFGGQIEVPYGFERLAWTRLPRAGEACVLRLLFRGRDERYSRFDFTLFGDDGQPLVDARGYRTVRLVQGGP